MIAKILKFISNIVLPHIIVIGLDVENSSIAAVARTVRYGQSKVIASNIYKLPEGSIVNGELKKPEELKNAIDAIIRKIPEDEGAVGISNEPIFVLSIPPNHLYTETAVLPEMSDADIVQSAKLKIETSLPWPKGGSYSDWTRIDAIDDRGMGIFIAGTSKPILDQYFKVFLENGWKVGACEFHLYSLGRFVSRQSDKPFMFVLVGEDGVEFAVYAYGSIISHNFENSPAAVREIGLIEDKVRQLTSYVNGTYGVNVEKIFVFDKVRMEETSNKLTDLTGIPAQMFVPDDSMEGLEPGLFIAYEAAGRPYSSSEPIINLMPEALGGRYQENLFAKTMMLWARVAAIFTGIFLIALAGVYLVLAGEENQLHAKNEGFAVTLAAQEAQAAPLIVEATDFNQLMDAVNEAKNLRTDTGKRLSDIIAEAGQDGLTLISARAGSEGAVIGTFAAPTRNDALAFQSAMQKDKLFSSVAIPLTELSPDTSLTINITLMK